MHDHIAAIPEAALQRYADAPTEGDGECTRWRGSIDRYGYGYIKATVAGRRRHYAAHRIAYLLAHRTVAAGLVIDHLCHTRDCVNPRHLEAVTNAENLRRGRPLHQPDCKQGHPLSGPNLFTRPDGGRGCRECRQRAGREHRARRKQAA